MLIVWLQEKQADTLLKQEENFLKLAASGEADNVLYINLLSMDGIKIARVFESGVYLGVSKSILGEDTLIYCVHNRQDVTAEEKRDKALNEKPGSFTSFRENIPFQTSWLLISI